MMEFSELFDTYLLPTAIILAQIFAIIVPLLVAVAYLTYFERKVIASMQLRKGPNVVGPFGLLQPLAMAQSFLSRRQFFLQELTKFYLPWLLCLHSF